MNPSTLHIFDAKYKEVNKQDGTGSIKLFILTIFWYN